MNYLRLTISVIAIAAFLSSCSRDDSRLKWTEDVLLPDGRTVTLTRYQEFKGPSEIGQPPSQSAYWFEFKNPDTGQKVRWETQREPGTVALLMDKGTPMLLARPLFGSGSREFGCPNPPYLLFLYADNKWERIDLASIPIKKIRSNMTYGAADRIDTVRANNGHLGLETTMNSTYQFKAWIMSFENVKQTFDQFNCNQPRDNLLVEEIDQKGDRK